MIHGNNAHSKTYAGKGHQKKQRRHVVLNDIGKGGHAGAFLDAVLGWWQYASTIQDGHFCIWRSSLDEWAEELLCSRATLERVISSLRKEGWIYAKAHKLRNKKDRPYGQPVLHIAPTKKLYHAIVDRCGFRPQLPELAEAVVQDKKWELDKWELEHSEAQVMRAVEAVKALLTWLAPPKVANTETEKAPQDEGTFPSQVMDAAPQDEGTFPSKRGDLPITDEVSPTKGDTEGDTKGDTQEIEKCGIPASPSAAILSGASLSRKETNKPKTNKGGKAHASPEKPPHPQSPLGSTGDKQSMNDEEIRSWIEDHLEGGVPWSAMPTAAQQRFGQMMKGGGL